MTWILALSIGPVGGFIAAGRRSRDLWYGSSWLSDTTAAVASRLIDPRSWPAGVEVELLLPSPRRLASLAALNDGMHGGRVSNKVLARVVCNASVTDPQVALRALADIARKAAVDHLLAALQKLRGRAAIRALLDNDAFDRQVEAIKRGDFVEFSAAWSPLPAGEDPFGRVVKRACELRDATPKLFRHPGFSRLGVARSDLDEGRDTVLASKPADGDLELKRARVGIIESEELDAIGLLRRTAAELPVLPFPPLSRVAADPWIEGCAANKSTKPELDALSADITAAKLAQREDFFVWCSPSNDPGITNFGYDAAVMFEGGCESLLSSTERLDKAARGGWAGASRVISTLRDIRVRVRNLHRLAGEPNPYYALLEVDGDRIGSRLTEQRVRDRYEALVEALDRFADSAAKIINTDHGTAFYVAGDELSAYIPLDLTLSLVSRLADRFRDLLSEGGFDGATLSAGVVFAHVKDDLRGVRRAARLALKRAKEHGPEHICIREMPRSGSDREIVGEIPTVVANVEALAKSIGEGHVSLRTEQHLREHLERFSAVPAVGGVEPGVLLARDAVRRQFERAGRDDAQHPLTARIDSMKSWNDVLRLADEIRVASRIYDVSAQRGGR